MTSVASSEKPYMMYEQRTVSRASCISMLKHHRPTMIEDQSSATYPFGTKHAYTINNALERFEQLRVVGNKTELYAFIC
eukprot:6200842-Pleurochrysis_carterae.AAC.3